MLCMSPRRRAAVQAQLGDATALPQLLPVRRGRQHHDGDVRRGGDAEKGREVLSARRIEGTVATTAGLEVLHVGL